MKNKKHLTIILLGLFLFSCSKNELELLQQNEKIKIENKYANANSQPPSMMVVTQTVKLIIEQNLGIEDNEITLTSKLVDDLGADELNIAEIVIDIENEFDIDFFDEDIDQLHTVQDYINFTYSRLQTVTIVGGEIPYIPPYTNPGAGTNNPGGTPPGGNPGGGGVGSPNAEDPGYAYELTVFANSIKLAERFDCFKNVPTNANTNYTIKLCADIPINSNPQALLFQGSPGHTFIELTKTNGVNSVTQTIGFYPESAKKASFQGSVTSMIVDNQNHSYDVSIINGINAIQFQNALNEAISKSANDYSITGYNCTNFALDVFNSACTANNKLIVPETMSRSAFTYLSYGITPNGLYQKIKEMNSNGIGGTSPWAGKGATSTKCN